MAASAALSATLSFTLGLALGPIFSALALQLGFYPTLLPFMLIMLMALRAMVGVTLYWPDRAREGAPTLSGQSQGTLRQGLAATGGAFFLCACTLFTAWVAAASLLAIGPNVARELLGMTDLGLFAYLANWVPVLLGWVSDHAGLGGAMDLLCLGGALASLWLAWRIKARAFYHG